MASLSTHTRPHTLHQPPWQPSSLPPPPQVRPHARTPRETAVPPAPRDKPGGGGGDGVGVLSVTRFNPGARTDTQVCRLSRSTQSLTRECEADQEVKVVGREERW